MIELKGSLRGLGLVPILQLLADIQETGRLRVSRGALTGQLDFEAGRLVAASFGQERGLAALAPLAVALPEAEFAFIAGEVPVEHNVDMSVDQLRAHLSRANGTLEPGSAVSHANGTLEPGSAAPLLGSVPRLLSSRNGQGERLELEHSALQLLLAVDGARSVAEIIGDRPVEPALRELGELVSLGLIRIDPPVRPVPTQRRVAAERADAWAARRRPVAAFRARSGWNARLRRPRSGRALLGVGIGLVMAIAATGVLILQPGLVPSPSPEPAPTAAPTPAAPRFAPADTQLATPVPQLALRPTVAPGAPRVPNPTGGAAFQTSELAGRTLIDARFSQRQAGWLERPPFARWADGAYRLTASEPGRFVAVGAPLPPNEPDVIVSATLRKTGGPPGGGYGLIVRDISSSALDGVSQTGSYYVLEVGDRGEIGAWRRDGNTWVDVQPWTTSPAVRTGGSPNDLVVEAIGDRLVFHVNDVEVMNAETDASLEAGRVGLFVGGDANEVALDRFGVQTPD